MLSDSSFSDWDRVSERAAAEYVLGEGLHLLGRGVEEGLGGLGVEGLGVEVWGLGFRV